MASKNMDSSNYIPYRQSSPSVFIISTTSLIPGLKPSLTSRCFRTSFPFYTTYLPVVKSLTIIFNLGGSRQNQPPRGGRLRCRHDLNFEHFLVFAIYLEIGRGIGREIVCTMIQTSILILASKAVAQLVVSCIVGYTFTKKGIITQGALTAMSRLVYYVFQPCLLFVKVASTVASPGHGIDKLLILPIFALLQVFFGLILGKGLEKIVCLEPGSPDARELRMGASFGNSGVLPLLFLDAMFSDSDGKHSASTAVAYVSFYLLGMSPAFWTVGYIILAGKSQVAAAALPLSEVKNTQSSSGPTSLSELMQQGASCWRKAMASPTTRKIFAPPFLGCVAGMIIGVIPWSYRVLLSEDAPLSPVLDSLQVIGRGYLPCAIFVLAGSLVKTQSNSESSPLDVAQARHVFYRKVVAIMISRFLVMPAVAVGTLIAGFRAGIIPYERLLWFVLLLEGCMPSAQNSVVILQMEERPDLAASMAKTLTTVYLLSAVPIAVLLSVMLQFVNKAETIL